MGASHPHSGSASSSSSSAPRSRMYRRPERIGWSAPRVASSTPLPIAYARLAREAANEAGGEYAARQVPLRCVA